MSARPIVAVLAGMLTLPGASHAEGAPLAHVQRVASVAVGKFRGGTARADLLFEFDESRELGAYIVRFTLSQATHRGPSPTSVAQVAVGPGLRRGARAQALPFVAADRRQIFVTYRHNRQTAAVIDYDGSRARVLYHSVGPCEVSAVKAGRVYRLAEDWPDQYWRENSTMGVGVRIGKDTVRRELRWNGSTFVPVHPGPAATVDPPHARAQATKRYVTPGRQVEVSQDSRWVATQPWGNDEATVARTDASRSRRLTAPWCFSYVRTGWDANGRLLLAMPLGPDLWTGSSGRTVLALLNPDTGALRRIVAPGAPAGGSAFSADGARVAARHIAPGSYTVGLLLWEPAAPGNAGVHVVPFRHDVYRFGWVSNRELLVVTKGADLGTRAVNRSWFLLDAAGEKSRPLAVELQGDLVDIAPVPDPDGRVWLVEGSGDRARLVRLAPDTGDVAALAELPAGPLSWQVQTIASGRVYVWRTLRNLVGVEILAVDARTGSRQRHATLGGAISISFDARGKGWWWEGSSLRSGGPW